MYRTRHLLGLNKGESLEEEEENLIISSKAQENRSHGGQSPPRSQRMLLTPRSFSRPSLVVLLCGAFLLFSGLWFVARLSNWRGIAHHDKNAMVQKTQNVQQSIADMTKSGDVNHDTAEPLRKAIVIASFMEQDVSWLDQLPSEWQIKRYVLDQTDPNANSEVLTVPRNQGREVMAYLTYIIDHYDDLPSVVLFIHGHFRAWHQPESITSKIRALNLTALEEEQFINFRCSNNPGCGPGTAVNPINPVQPALKYILPFWNSIVGEQEPLPHIRAHCCAQFAVTKKAILSRPREQWIRARAPLLRDLVEYPPWGPTQDGYTVGMLYEYTWHLLFRKQGFFCPTPEYCREVFFSNAITCDGYTGIFPAEGWEDIKCTSAFDGPIDEFGAEEGRPGADEEQKENPSPPAPDAVGPDSEKPGYEPPAQPEDDTHPLRGKEGKPWDKRPGADDITDHDNEPPPSGGIPAFPEGKEKGAVEHDAKENVAPNEPPKQVPADAAPAGANAADKGGDSNKPWKPGKDNGEKPPSR